MSEYVPQKGDKVRVILEGEVQASTADEFMLGGLEHGSYNWLMPAAEHVVSIEKAPTPLVKFKQGDTLRRRNDSAPVILTETGYTYLDSGKHYEHTNPGARGRDEFNSREYSKIVIDEAPF